MFLWIIFSGYNIIYGQEAKRIVTDHMAQLLGFQKIYSEKNSLIILQVACKWKGRQSKATWCLQNHMKYRPYRALKTLVFSFEGAIES